MGRRKEEDVSSGGRCGSSSASYQSELRVYLPWAFTDRQQIQDRLTKISRDTSLQSSHRLTQLQQRLTDLQHRVLRLASESLQINAAQSIPLKPEEHNMVAQLQDVKAELEGRSKSAKNGALRVGTPTRRKQGEGRMTGVVNELYGAIEEIRRRRRLGGTRGVDQGWLADERVLQEVAEVSTARYKRR
jgi:nuclear pore complex protein Nup54